MEIDSAIFCACMPACRVLLHKILPTTQRVSEDDNTLQGDLNEDNNDHTNDGSRTEVDAEDKT